MASDPTPSESNDEPAHPQVSRGQLAALKPQTWREWLFGSGFAAAMIASGVALFTNRDFLNWLAALTGNPPTTDEQRFWDRNWKCLVEGAGRVVISLEFVTWHALMTGCRDTGDIHVRIQELAEKNPNLAASTLWMNREKIEEHMKLQKTRRTSASIDFSLASTAFAATAIQSTVGTEPADKSCVEHASITELQERDAIAENQFVQVFPIGIVCSRQISPIQFLRRLRLNNGDCWNEVIDVRNGWVVNAWYSNCYDPC